MCWNPPIGRARSYLYGSFSTRVFTRRRSVIATAKLALLLCLLVPSGGSALAEDLCTPLLNSDKSNFSERLLSWLTGSDPAGSHLTPITEVYATVHSGFALTPICDTSTPVTRWTSFLYYPAGVVVGRLGTDVTEIDGKNYYGVLSEYGLTMYLRQSDIVPLAANASYLFVDSGVNIPYCTARNCKDPTLNAPAETNLLLTGGGGSDGRARYGMNVLADKAGKGCTRYSFQPAEDGRILPTTTDRVFISDCWSGFKNIDTSIPLPKMRVKLVNRAPYEHLFAQGIRGSLGSFGEQFVGTRFGLSNQKGCHEQDEVKVTADGKVKANFYVFSAGFGMSVSASEELPEGEFYYFDHYSLVDSSGATRFGIASITQCHESQADTPEEIDIYGSGMGSDYVSVGIQDLIDVYGDLFKLRGYQKPIAPNFYRQGKFFIVDGLVPYFALRDVLRVDLAGVVNQVQERYPDPAVKKQVVDFFTHLLMASSAMQPPQ